MCSQKFTQKSYKIRKTVYIPEDEWVVVESTYEPIIDNDTFERVQKLVKYRKRANKGNHTNLLLDCFDAPDCGGVLNFQAPKAGTGTRSGQYTCNKYRHSAVSEDGRRTCTLHYLPYANLYAVVQERLNILFGANLTVENIRVIRISNRLDFLPSFRACLGRV